MGFLSDLLSPKKHLERVKGGVKSLTSGDIKGFLDPMGLISGKKPNPAEAAVEEQVGPDVTDPSLYMGDESDPAYGSYSDPFDVEDFYAQQDPGYAFELQQGMQALQNSAAAGSGVLSGAALKDLLQYSQGFARTGYNDAFNRHQTQQGNIFNRLRDIATIGQSAAAGVGTQGTALAGNAGQMLSNAGSAYGAGIVGAGNALGNAGTNYWLMKNYMPQPAVAGAGGV
jgi:hypothetical protein